MGEMIETCPRCGGPTRWNGDHIGGACTDPVTEPNSQPAPSFSKAGSTEPSDEAALVLPTTRSTDPDLRHFIVSEDGRVTTFTGGYFLTTQNEHSDLGAATRLEVYRLMDLVMARLRTDYPDEAVSLAADRQRVAREAVSEALAEVEREIGLQRNPEPIIFDRFNFALDVACGIVAAARERAGQ